MNKQLAIKKLAELEEKAAELKAIIDKPEVKPLFPTSREEGARFFAQGDGSMSLIREFISPRQVANYAKQCRTFYTREAAEALAKRERARAYCLERINEVNEGDNGFRIGGDNYTVDYHHFSSAFDVGSTFMLQNKEPSEYIRTKRAALQLINDPDFVENWKIWKGVE